MFLQCGRVWEEVTIIIILDRRCHVCVWLLQLCDYLNFRIAVLERIHAVRADILQASHKTNIFFQNLVKQLRIAYSHY